MARSPPLVFYNLFTFSFVDDVTFSHNWLYGALSAFSSGESAIIETTASIPTTSCSTIKIHKYTHRVFRGVARIFGLGGEGADGTMPGGA